MRRFTKAPRRLSAEAAITRREALRTIGAGAGAAAAMPWLASCGGGGGDVELQPEELDIETVVFVMMENRSFDHYLGSLALEGRGFDRVDGLRPGLSNASPRGVNVAPFHLAERCIADPPHSWTSSFEQVNGGAMDNFVREYHETLLDDGFSGESDGDVMGYHTRDQLPFLYALADEFAVCDQWFSAVRGPTWPNRMYMHSATSNGRMNNAFPADINVGFTWPTIYDRVRDGGLEWKAYFGDLSLLLLWGHLRAQTNRIVGFEQFVDDARSGRLPHVAQIEPTFFGPSANDDHPPHDFERGQAFLSMVVNAVAQGPQWQKSLIIVTYDEHGGFYDHVAPPTVPDERSAEGFGQLGVRVPSIVISPYTNPMVSSEVREHSSIPAFIEWLYGLSALTIRDRNANFLRETLDRRRIRNANPRSAPNLPIIDVDPEPTPECLALNETQGGGVELAALADQLQLEGRLDYRLDRRATSADRLRWLNRELIRMGVARARPRR